MVSPQVSVLLKSFRSNPEWLVDAIDSVRGQTFGDFELLVLDDSHSSQVCELVASYHDHRIHYVRGPGKGPGYNQLYGLMQAKAPVIANIDHDDLWHPGMLKRLVTAYRSVPDVVLAFADHWILREDGTIDRERSTANSKQWRRTGLRSGVHQPFHRLALVDGSVPLAQAALFSRDVAMTLDPRVGQTWDRYVTYLLARTGRPAIYVPERLAAWRASTVNLTHSRTVHGAVADFRMRWYLYRDPVMKCLRGELLKAVIRSGRGVLGAIRHLLSANSAAVIRRRVRRDNQPQLCDTTAVRDFEGTVSSGRVDRQRARLLRETWMLGGATADDSE